MRLRRSPGCERARFRAARGIAALALISCAGSPEGPGGRPLYRWTDAEGGQHYALDPDDVPSQARAGVEVLASEEPPPDTGADSGEARAPEPVAATPLPDPPPPQQASAPPPEGGARPALLPISAPAPAEPPLGVVRYAIQLSAGAVAATSAGLPELSLPAGRQLYASDFERGGRSWRRLRVGFYASRAEALLELRALEGRFPGAWVAEVDSVEWQRASRGGEGAPTAPPALPAPRSVPAQTQPAPSPPEGAYTLQLFARPQGERLGVIPVHDLFHTKILYVLASEVSGREFRRVRLGFFASEHEVEAARRSLREHFPEAWVARADAADRAEAAKHRIVPDEPAPAPSGAAPPLRE